MLGHMTRVFVHCRLKCNLPKNRYKDVVCYDESRVVLQSIPGVEGSDYIHANYVAGYNRPQAFILTQGRGVCVCVHVHIILEHGLVHWLHYLTS